MKMLTWYFGDRTGYRLAPGKSGRCIKNHVDPELWEQVLETYADSECDNIWNSLFVMGDVFRSLARSVAHHHRFHYCRRDDENVTNHLRHVRQLPKDAMEIY